MKIKKLIITATIVLVSALSLSTRATLTYAKQQAFKVDAKAAFAFDQKTGKIFYAKNADKPLGIASITKILSSYIVLEKIHQKKLNWTDKIPIKEYPYELTLNTELSNVPLEKGTSYSVKELFDSGMIASASSGVIALAEKVAGTEAKFVEMMKKKLKEWGIKEADVQLVNSTGINNSFVPEKYHIPGSKKDQENMMSARSVAVVAYHLLNDYPEILEVSKKTKEQFGVGTFSEFEMKNLNGMLPGMNWEYEGIDGLKTGTSELAGQCFVGTCLKKNQRIVTVVLHANGAEENNGARYTETADLMDFVHDNWKYEQITSKGKTLKQVKTLSVKDGKKDNVALVLGEDVKDWVCDDMNKDNLQMSWDKSHKKALTAPVKKDENVGKVTIQLKDDKLGYLLPSQQQHHYQMVTNEDVKRQFFLKVWGNHILEWLDGKFK
ncbi:MAG: D-alanyl-D-alanine carboxypeptidase [Lactobacillales bacterium]|jgi:D-alanyl-D-alanine carboxypeptidase (penicillin-binding protein 5/6)|nr:D-alanyl-D-alanine carboxypeptidase [Lactobacillales bacterium]